MFDGQHGLKDKQADMCNALQCQLFANVNRDPDRAAFSLSDFLLFGDPPPEKTAAEIDAELRMAFAPLVKK